MHAHHNVIVTGFEPFNHGAVNASWQAVSALPNELNLHGASIHLNIEELPVTYDGAARRVRELVREYEPLAAIHVGLNEAARAIMLETQAVNEQNASIPDNAGVKRGGEPITDGGPHVLQARWDAPALAASLTARGFPVDVSHDARRYVCNTALYTAIAAQPSVRYAGFVHVPTAEVIPSSTVTRALIALIEELLWPHLC